MSQEILNANNFNQLDEKSDIFSLGLSIFEIVCKIELPPNGEAWRFIRSENFKLSKEYLKNSNMKNIPNEMILLISDMIRQNSQDRKDLNTIIEEYGELKARYMNYLEGTYSRNAAFFAEITRSTKELRDTKRSDSFKSSIF